MPRVNRTYEHVSRREWVIPCDENESGGIISSVSTDDIRMGCLLRIAKATEVIAQNHQQLMDDRDMYQRWYREECRKVRHLRNVIAGLRGALKRAKGGK